MYSKGVRNGVRAFFDPKCGDPLINLIRYFLVFLAVMLYYPDANGFGDVVNYYGQISSLMDGQMPYRDYTFEYPPVLILVLLVPKIFSWNQDSYGYIYGIWAFLCFLLCVHIGRRIAEHYGKDPYKIYLLGLVLLLVMNRYVMMRNDIFVALFVLIAVWFLIEKRYLLSFAFLGVGTMTKLYPALLAVLLFTALLAKGDRKNAFTGIVCTAVICLLIELPFLIADPASAFDYMSYNSDRGIQIESIIGSVFEFVNIFDPGFVQVVGNFGSHNLEGDWPEGIAPYMTYIMGIASLAFILWAAWRMRGLDRERWTGALVLAFEITVMVCLTFSKVYSAQYFIWFCALYPVVHLEMMNKTYLGKLSLFALPLILFTTINAMFTYFELVDLLTKAILVNVAKNLFHILLMCGLVKVFLNETRKDADVPTKERPVAA